MEVEAELCEFKLDLWEGTANIQFVPQERQLLGFSIYYLVIVKTLLAQGHDTQSYHLTNEEFDHFSGQLVKLLRK